MALDPVLEEVLARLCAEVGPLHKTQAVKLPYLVDVVAFHVLGKRLTDGIYQAWDYGVVERKIYGLITSARYSADPLEGTPFLVEDQPGYEDRQIINLEAPPATRLDEAAQEIVEFVATQYGRLSPSKLGRLTKTMNPQIQRWPSTKRVLVNDLAYGRLPVKWDEVDQELASQSLREIQERPETVIRGQELDRELAEILR